MAGSQIPGRAGHHPQGPNRYGASQNMDITNPHFRQHAERVIRQIMEHVNDHPAIIGYQVDNETKAYNMAGPEVQKQFVQYIKVKYKTLDVIDKAFGLDYWGSGIGGGQDAAPRVAPRW